MDCVYYAYRKNVASYFNEISYHKSVVTEFVLHFRVLGRRTVTRGRAIQWVLCNVSHVLQSNSRVSKKPHVFQSGGREAIAFLIEKEMLESSGLTKPLLFCLKCQ